MPGTQEPDERINIHRKLFCLGLLACLLVLPRCTKTHLKDIAIRKILSVGGVEVDLIYKLAGLVLDEQGNVIVLDLMDCSIKIFDKSGHLVKKGGHRGQGPGEFMSPQIIKRDKKSIYVYDQGLACIHVFDKDLNFLFRSQLSFPISDMEILSSEEVLIHSFVLESPLKIARWNLKENSSSKPISYKDMGNSLIKSLRFEVDKTGNLYVCHLFEDKVEAYDKNMKNIWSRILMGGIKAKTETRTNKMNTFELPLELIYKDIELDESGHVFVLVGHIGPNRSREVYVLDAKTGGLEGTFVLSEPSHFICVDSDDSLYSSTGEATGYAKYLITY